MKDNSFNLAKERSRRYPAQTITDADYADDITLLANTPNQAESLLHRLKRVAAGIDLHVNADETEYMCFNQRGDVFILKGSSLKLVEAEAWTAIDKLSVIWKSDLIDKIKRSFFQTAVVSILQYGCITWMLTKRMEKKLDSNYTRMLRAILNKFWRQHPIKQQLYCHLQLIAKTIQVRRTRYAGHCWISRDELVSDILQWTPSHGQAKSGRPARTYIQQFCADTGYNLEDLPGAMDDRDGWWERIREICAGSVTWCWWWSLWK